MKKLTANMTRRQIIALTLAALPAVGCAKQEANNDTSDDISSGEQEANNDASDDIPSEEQPTSSETQIATVAIGETVSTDIVELTLDRAEFATALYNGISTEAVLGQTPIDEVELGLPKEYDASADADNPYVAPVGHVLVAYTVTVSNLDRTALDLDEWSSSDFVTLTYSNQELSADKKETVLIICADGSLFSSPALNLPLSASDTSTVRRYAEFAIEPESLTDPFQLTFSLPNSQGEKEHFTYQIG